MHLSFITSSCVCYLAKSYLFQFSRHFEIVLLMALHGEKSQGWGRLSNLPKGSWLFLRWLSFDHSPCFLSSSLYLPLGGGTLPSLIQFQGHTLCLRVNVERPLHALSC